MILFACDLDGTLIRSHRRRRPEDICVEIYEGREQSFISPQALETLHALNKRVLFVPVTSRSLAQYARLPFLRAPENASPYALAANGGFLLENQNLSMEWAEDSIRMANGSRAALQRAPEVLERCGCSGIRTVDGLFVCAKLPPGGVEKARMMLADEPLDLVEAKTTLYVLPKGCHKGIALQRLKERFSPHFTITAGNCRMDIEMLNEADVALVPDDFDAKNLLAETIRQTPENPDFALFLLSKAMELAVHLSGEKSCT